MTRLRIAVARILAIFMSRRLDRELESEIQGHLEMQASDNVKHGLLPSTAESAARRDFGGVQQIKEHYRDLRGVPWLETIVQDLRHGTRILGRNPAFTVVAVLSLAVGIGANTATFSLADAMILRPLPVRNPNRVVVAGSLDRTSEGNSNSLGASYPDYVDLRDGAQSFSGLTATLTTRVQFASTPDARPDIRTGMLVSGNYFDAMGIEPAIGRVFGPEEDRVPARDAIVVLGHAFWQREFGGNPTVIGRSVRINGIDFTVVGAVPEWFTGTDQFIRPEFFAPLMMWPSLERRIDTDPLEARDMRRLTLKGRLADGTSIDEARAEVESIGVALSQEYPESNRSHRMFVRTEMEDRIDEFGAEAILMLMVLAGAVLVIACLNVAGLLTSRAPSRSGEMALRLSIGARRGRIVRQLFTENLLLGLLGGSASILVGYLGMLLWRQLATGDIVMVFEMDRRALAVSLAVSVGGVLLFGLTPAIQTAKSGLSHAIRTTGRGGTRRQWGRGALVMGQIAVSLTLLSVAGFMYASFLRQLEAGPGYRIDHLLAVRFDPTPSGYDDGQIQRFYQEIVDRSIEVSGVESATVASYVPMSGTAAGTRAIRPEGYDFPEGTESASVLTNNVSAGFFEVMNIPILEGRGFDRTDSAESPRVAVVNEALANHYWPDASPVGRRFRLDGADGPWVEIVGVTPTGRYYAISEPPQEFLYLSNAQDPRPQMTLLVGTLGDPGTLSNAVRDLAGRVAPDLGVLSTRTMEELYYDGAVRNFLVVMRAIAAMGLMGATLAFAGLYGLVAFAVSSRTREIGVRMAIGASPQSVMRMVLGQGMRLAFVGLVAGLILTFLADRAMVAAFPGGGGSARGIDEYIVWTAALLVVTLTAAYLPARRAARIAPTEALRAE